MNDFSFVVLVVVVLFKDRQGTKLLNCVSYSLYEATGPLSRSGSSIPDV